MSFWLSKNNMVFTTYCVSIAKRPYLWLLNLSARASWRWWWWCSLLLVLMVLCIFRNSYGVSCNESFCGNECPSSTLWIISLNCPKCIHPCTYICFEFVFHCIFSHCTHTMHFQCAHIVISLRFVLHAQMMVTMMTTTVMLLWRVLIVYTYTILCCFVRIHIRINVHCSFYFMFISLPLLLFL